eukprot:CFRG4132T1
MLDTILVQDSDSDNDTEVTFRRIQRKGIYEKAPPAHVYTRHQTHMNGKFVNENQRYEIFRVPEDSSPTLSDRGSCISTAVQVHRTMHLKKRHYSRRKLPTSLVVKDKKIDKDIELSGSDDGFENVSTPISLPLRGVKTSSMTYPLDASYKSTPSARGAIRTPMSHEAVSSVRTYIDTPLQSQSYTRQHIKRMGVIGNTSGRTLSPTYATYKPSESRWKKYGYDNIEETSSDSSPNIYQHTGKSKRALYSRSRTKRHTDRQTHTSGFVSKGRVHENSSRTLHLGKCVQQLHAQSHKPRHLICAFNKVNTPTERMSRGRERMLGKIDSNIDVLPHVPSDIDEKTPTFPASRTQAHVQQEHSRANTRINTKHATDNTLNNGLIRTRENERTKERGVGVQNYKEASYFQEDRVEDFTEHAANVSDAVKVTCTNSYGMKETLNNANQTESLSHVYGNIENIENYDDFMGESRGEMGGKESSRDIIEKLEDSVQSKYKLPSKTHTSTSTKLTNDDNDDVISIGKLRSGRGYIKDIGEEDMSIKLSPANITASRITNEETIDKNSCVYFSDEDDDFNIDAHVRVSKRLNAENAGAKPMLGSISKRTLGMTTRMEDSHDPCAHGEVSVENVCSKSVRDTLNRTVLNSNRCTYVCDEDGYYENVDGHMIISQMVSENDLDKSTQGKTNRIFSDSNRFVYFSDEDNDDRLVFHGSVAHELSEDAIVKTSNEFIINKSKYTERTQVGQTHTKRAIMEISSDEDSETGHVTTHSPMPTTSTRKRRLIRGFKNGGSYSPCMSPISSIKTLPEEINMARPDMWESETDSPKEIESENEDGIHNDYVTTDEKESDRENPSKNRYKLRHGKQARTDFQKFTEKQKDSAFERLRKHKHTTLLKSSPVKMFEEDSNDAFVQWTFSSGRSTRQLPQALYKPLPKAVKSNMSVRKIADYMHEGSDGSQSSSSEDDFEVNDCERNEQDKTYNKPEVAQAMNTLLHRGATTGDVHQAFSIFLEMNLSNAIDASFFVQILQDKDDYYYPALRQIRAMITSRCDMLIPSSGWQTIKHCVDDRPRLNNEKLTGRNVRAHCQACGRSKHTASMMVQLSGLKYDPTTLIDIDEVCENTGKENGRAYMRKFDCGPTCGKRITAYHKLRHYPYTLFQRCRHKMRSFGTVTDRDGDLVDKVLDDKQWVSNQERDFWKMLEVADSLGRTS